MKGAARVLLYYSALVSLFMVVSSYLNGNTTGTAIFAPVALYFVWESLRSLKKGHGSVKVGFEVIIPALVALVILIGIGTMNIWNI